MFVVPTDIVRCASFSLSHHEVQRTTMVGHVEPVTHILARAVNRYLLTEETLTDDERYELLGKLVGPVVVRASGPDDWCMVRVNGCLAEKVGRSFRSTVGTAWVKGCALHKESFLAK